MKEQIPPLNHAEPHVNSASQTALMV